MVTARVPAPPIQAPTVAPPPRSTTTRAPAARRLTGPPAVVLRTAQTAPAATAQPAQQPLPPQVAQLVNAPSAGEPIPFVLRRQLERSFDVDLRSVRVHSDPRTTAIVDRLGARAFTYGLHIFLGSGEKPTDRELMAHEVAHVIQQQGTPFFQPYTEMISASGDRFERDAGQAAAAAMSGSRASVQERTGTARVQKQDAPEQEAGWFERQAWSLLQAHAPQLVPILRQGVLEWLRERLSTVVQTIVDDLARPVRAVREVAATVGKHFASLVGWMREAAAKIARNDCSSITEAADKIQQVFEGLAAPVIDRVKQFAGDVRAFFQGLWDRFGAPIWDLLKRIGGAIWEQIERVGRWIWEKTAPIRDWLARAWRWFKNWLGIGEGEEGQNGVLQWFQRKASAAWEWVMARLGPFKRPLLIIAGVLLLLSPAGPIIAVAGAAAGIMRAVQWIRQNLRSRNAAVQQRGFLRGVLLPGILNTIGIVKNVISTVANTVTGALNRVVNGVNELAAAVNSIPILSFAGGLINFVADQFRGLLAWATGGVQGIAAWMSSGLDRLGGFAQRFIAALEVAIRVTSNFLRNIYMLGERVWNAVPACIRDPFIDWFIPLILRQVSFFRALVESPDVWKQTRNDVMVLIRQVFRDFDIFGAIRTAFRLVMRTLRIPIELGVQVLRKAAEAWDAVIAAPLRFVENVIKAALRGIGRFMRNILSHLWYGVQGWLFNSINQGGTGRSLTPPSNWLDLRQVFGFVLDILGISLDHVFELMARRGVSQNVIRRLRQMINFLTGAWEWVKVAINEGPRGLWRLLVQALSNLGNIVLEQAVNWVMTRIIAIVSARLTALAASAGLSGVLEAIYAIYQAIQTAVEYARRILEIMLVIFTTIVQIAQGVLDPAAEMLERGLRLAMPVVIGFLANYAGLGGVGHRIREIVEQVRARVDAALIALIDRALAAGRSVLNLIERGVQAVRDWWQSRFDFSDERGRPHAVYFRGSDASSARLMVESTPVAVDQFLIDAQARADALTDPTDKANRHQAIEDARTAIAELDRITYRRGGRPPANQAIEERAVNAQLRRLSDKLRILMRDVAGTDAPVPRISVIPGFSGTKATGLQVKFLFNGQGNHDPGTPASEYAGTLSGALPLLEQMGVRSDWVAFHILNENTGGLAVDSNLIPATRDNNGDYLRRFEDPHLKDRHDHGDVVWMDARFSYRDGDGFPEFVGGYTATGGVMKFNRSNSTWEPDTTKNFPTYNITIPLPRPQAIFINRLPTGTSVTDRRLRSLATRETAMTASTLELIAQYRRVYGQAVVWNREYLIRYYERAVEEFDPGRSPITRRNDQYGIDNANIDYVPR